ncbi:YdcF family protein [Corynebacterium sp. A21]|uniref:YdcF family protein n=1 Tax=Corynebacterium sp. A21 TaxID=3457318 RepID=UPI003FD6293F
MRIRGGPAARRRNRRFRRLALSAALVLVALVVGMSTWVLLPSQGTPVPSDAVMVIAGSTDGRHQAGAQLIEEGIAQNFVVSNPSGTRDKVGSAHCRGEDRPEAALRNWCLRPEPVTTTGEALTMGELAAEEEWSSATVLTSRIHARRVQAMFRECTNLEVTVVFMDYIWIQSVLDEVLHEVGGHIKLWLTDPCQTRS